MSGTTYRQHRNTPFRFTSITCRQASGGYSQSVWFGPVMPAFATRMSMAPSASAVAATAASTLAALETSTALVWTVPCPDSSAAVDSTRFASRSQRETAAPDARKRSAMARPIPCAPPVTTARLPARSIWFMCASHADGSACQRSARSGSLDQGASCSSEERARSAGSGASVELLDQRLVGEPVHLHPAAGVGPVDEDHRRRPVRLAPQRAALAPDLAVLELHQRPPAPALELTRDPALHGWRASGPQPGRQDANDQPADPVAQEGKLRRVDLLEAGFVELDAVHEIGEIQDRSRSRGFRLRPRRSRPEELDDCQRDRRGTSSAHCPLLGRSTTAI